MEAGNSPIQEETQQNQAEQAQNPPRTGREKLLDGVRRIQSDKIGGDFFSRFTQLKDQKRDLQAGYAQAYGEKRDAEEEVVRREYQANEAKATRESLLDKIGNNGEETEKFRQLNDVLNGAYDEANLTSSELEDAKSTKDMLVAQMQQELSVLDRDLQQQIDDINNQINAQETFSLGLARLTSQRDASAREKIKIAERLQQSGQKLGRQDDMLDEERAAMDVLNRGVQSYSQQASELQQLNIKTGGEMANVGDVVLDLERQRDQLIADYADKAGEIDANFDAQILEADKNVDLLTTKYNETIAKLEQAKTEFFGQVDRIVRIGNIVKRMESGRIARRLETMAQAQRLAGEVRKRANEISGDIFDRLDSTKTEGQALIQEVQQAVSRLEQLKAEIQSLGEDEIDNLEESRKQRILEINKNLSEQIATINSLEKVLTQQVKAEMAQNNFEHRKLHIDYDSDDVTAINRAIVESAKHDKAAIEQRAVELQERLDTITSQSYDERVDARTQSNNNIASSNDQALQAIGSIQFMVDRQLENIDEMLEKFDDLKIQMEAEFGKPQIEDQSSQPLEDQSSQPQSKDRKMTKMLKGVVGGLRRRFGRSKNE